MDRSPTLRNDLEEKSASARSRPNLTEIVAKTSKKLLKKHAVGRLQSSFYAAKGHVACSKLA